MISITVNAHNLVFIAYSYFYGFTSGQFMKNQPTVKKNGLLDRYLELRAFPIFNFQLIYVIPI